MAQINFDLKDIFISYSHKDKDEYVEPLVVALEGAGISCWYDQLEMAPGESISEQINKGLTSSKIILFCISNNFLDGNWSVKELNAAIGLSVLPEGKYRLIPLMIVDPQVVQEAYPVPFADMVYLNWDKDLNNIISDIRKVLSQIDQVDKEYWMNESKKAYSQKNYQKSAIYSKKSTQYDNEYFPAFVMHIASLFRLSMIEDVWNFIFEYEDYWSRMDEEGVDVQLLDYVQDNISNLVVGDEIDDVSFTFAIKDILATETNSERSWKYIKRLYEKPEFEYHQSYFIKYVGYIAREKALEWFSTILVKSKNTKNREAVANLLYFLACTEPDIRPQIVILAENLTKDVDEDVRTVAIVTDYFYGNNGRERTLKALKDRSVKVRSRAIDLLSGSFNYTVDQNWESSDGEKRDPDLLLTSDVVKELLQEPDERLFGEILDSVIDGKLPSPIDVDIEQIINQRGHSRQAREAKVKILANKGTVESHSEILDIAINDSNEFVRSDAIRALEKSSFPIKSIFLRSLYEVEVTSFSRRNVYDLIIKKGDDSLVDIYFEIFKEKVDDSIFFPDDVFGKILKSMDRDYIKKVFEITEQKEKLEEITSNMIVFLDLELIDEVKIIVNYCLNEKLELEDNLLVAGKLENIPDSKIEDFLDTEDLHVQIAAIRALEYRPGSGNGLEKLKGVFEKEIETLKTGNLQAGWTLLRVADAFLEFEGANSAIPMLEIIYSELEKIMQSSFPLRAVWERLKILGITKSHTIYEDADPTTPSPWPNRNGPFYGIKT